MTEAKLEPCDFSGLDPAFCAHCRGHHQHVHIDDVERILGRPAPEYRWQHRIVDRPVSIEWRQAAAKDIIDCTPAHDRRDRFMCESCETLFENLIGDIPALIEGLDQAATRQVQFVEHGTPTSDPDEAPLGLFMAATRTIADIRDLLVYPDMPTRVSMLTRNPTTAATTQARWMLAHWTDVMRDPNISEVAGDISTKTRYALKLIDRPKDVVFLGECPSGCGAQLTPEKDADTVQCPNDECHWAGTVAQLIGAWILQGDERYLTAAELRLAIPDLNDRLLQRWVKHDGVARQEMTRPRWKSGGLLDARKVETYKLGSVKDLMIEHRQLQQFAELERSTETWTSQETATKLGLSIAALWKLVERGRLRPVKPGAKPLRFTPAEVERFRQARSA